MQVVRVALGIDIGGTTCKLGLVTEDGTLVHQTVIPTQAADGGEALLSRLVAAARPLLQQAPVCGVGVGTAGMVDPITGAVRFATATLPGWTGMPLRDRLAAALGVPVAVDNDANVVALAEQRFGAARGLAEVVCITLGTGVGGGVISGGRLVRGRSGGGGEIGHMVVEAGGRPCPCGWRGCLEAYASATAIAARAREVWPDPPVPTVQEVFVRAAAGEAVAWALVDEAARYLAAGIATLAAVLDPELVLIGGGVSAAGERLLGPVRRHLAMHPVARHVVVAPCALGPEAGVIGAAALVLTANGNG